LALHPRSRSLTRRGKSKSSCVFTAASVLQFTAGAMRRGGKKATQSKGFGVLLCFLYGAPRTNSPGPPSPARCRSHTARTLPLLLVLLMVLLLLPFCW
jgi:hypothetical protein